MVQRQIRFAGARAARGGGARASLTTETSGECGSSAGSCCCTKQEDVAVFCTAGEHVVWEGGAAMGDGGCTAAWSASLEGGSKESEAASASAPLNCARGGKLERFVSRFKEGMTGGLTLFCSKLLTMLDTDTRRKDGEGRVTWGAAAAGEAADCDKTASTCLRTSDRDWLAACRFRVRLG